MADIRDGIPTIPYAVMLLTVVLWLAMIGVGLWGLFHG